MVPPRLDQDGRFKKFGATADRRHRTRLISPEVRKVFAKKSFCSRGSTSCTAVVSPVPVNLAYETMTHELMTTWHRRLTKTRGEAYRRLESTDGYGITHVYDTHSTTAAHAVNIELSIIGCFMLQSSLT